MLKNIPQEIARKLTSGASREIPWQMAQNLRIWRQFVVARQNGIGLTNGIDSHAAAIVARPGAVFGIHLPYALNSA